MRIYIFLFTTFIVVTQGRAQKASFIEIRGGPTFPVGKFAEKGLPEAVNTDIANPPGAALVGVGFAAAAGFYVTSNAGVVLTVSNSRNKQSAGAFRDALREMHPDHVVTVSTRHWSTTSVLAGVIMENHLSAMPKLSYCFNVQAGIAFTNVPGYAYVIFNPQTTFATELTANKKRLPGRFAVAAGGAVKYVLSKQWYVQLTGEYFHSTPQRKFNFNPNFPQPGSQDVTQKRPQQALKISTGAGMYFLR